jgi:mRNA interferase MazF
MTPPEPGDVVVLRFPGAAETKRRPAVVLSSEEYHAMRPDVILGILTTAAVFEPTGTDHALADWRDRT